MIDKLKLGKMIALQRKSCELTQKELADLLHVSYQAVSKWELGQSLPSVDMLCDIATILNITVDYLLHADEIDNRDICYQDTGLDTVRLYNIKDQINQMISADPHLLYAHYTQPVILKEDIEQNNKNPVYALITNVPGSKMRLAKERGYDREICADLVAHAINHMLTTGLRPTVLQAHMVCGNNAEQQMLAMAKAFKETCEENQVIFAGMEISAQPVNYLAGEYELSVALLGSGDQTDLITGNKVQEGDVLIAIKTEGIESSSFPFIRVMLERKPQLAYAKINEQDYFLDEILKPNCAYTKEIEELCKRGILNYVVRLSCSFLSSYWMTHIPSDLGAVINLSELKVDETYQFIAGLDLLGKRFLPYRFSMGYGMIVIVPKERAQETLDVIHKNHEANVIGYIRKWNDKLPNNHLMTEGKIKW